MFGNFLDFLQLSHLSPVPAKHDMSYAYREGFKKKKMNALKTK
jgi:hypothetical protein